MKSQNHPRQMTTPVYRITLLIAALCLLNSTTAVCADDTAATTNSPALTLEPNKLVHRFGAGIVVGEPTGASLKYFFSETLAVDGALGWSFYDDADFDAHSDVLFHRHHLVDTSAGDLAGYLGVGGRVQIRDNADDRFGVRVPVGVSFMLEKVPVDVFGEIAPIVDFSPSVEGALSGGVGVRYWF